MFASIFFAHTLHTVGTGSCGMLHFEVSVHPLAQTIPFWFFKYYLNHLHTCLFT